MEFKETLEEVAEKNWDKINYQFKGGLNPYAHRIGFIEGAKWQIGRMYSEAEVNEIIAETWLSVEDNEGDETFSQARERILEQFKKR
jgi:hypothetical protein